MYEPGKSEAIHVEIAVEVSYGLLKALLCACANTSDSLSSPQIRSTPISILERTRHQTKL